jgi:hypothetical protein
VRQLASVTGYNLGRLLVVLALHVSAPCEPSVRSTRHMKHLAASSVKQTPLERHPPSFVPVTSVPEIRGRPSLSSPLTTSNLTQIRTLMENSTNAIFWYGKLACRFPVGLWHASRTQWTACTRLDGRLCLQPPETGGWSDNRPRCHVLRTHQSSAEHVTDSEDRYLDYGESVFIGNVLRIRKHWRKQIQRTGNTQKHEFNG